MDLKPILLEYSGTAQTFDDSGWGYKSCSEYKITLYYDSSFVILIKGTLVNADSGTMCIYQTDTIALIKGVYKLDCSKNDLEVKSAEYFCNVDQCEFEAVEKVSGAYESTQTNRDSRQIENFKFKINNNDNKQIVLLFSSSVKNDVFMEFHTNPNWFYLDEWKNIIYYIKY